QAAQVCQPARDPLQGCLLIRGQPMLNEQVSMFEQLAHLLLLPGGLALRDWARSALRGRPRGCLGMRSRSFLRVAAKACSTALVISLMTWNSQTLCGTSGHNSFSGSGYSS